MLQNWQTTIAGIACIAGGIYLITSGKGAVEGGAMIAAGLGLLRAKDGTTHSTVAQTQQATVEAAK
jgi:hypothetical protein